MQLVPNKIPPEFIQSIPKGFRLIKREGADYLLVESIFCPHGHNIIVDSVRIHDEASIKLKVVINGASGFIFVDSFWGSHEKLFSFVPPVAAGQEVYADACCPYCEASLIEEYACSAEGCGSKRSFQLLLPGSKNKIHICARLGCPGHHLEVTDLPYQLINSIDQINFFGFGSDEHFGGI